jgi:hypothetical protein
MRTKILALSVILILTTVTLSSISFAQAAGEGQWITSYQIRDGATDQLLVDFDFANGVNTTYSPVLPGATIKVTFTIHVFTGGSGDLRLVTSLTKTNPNGYWQLVSQNYSLGANYNPNQQSTPFNWVVGTFTMAVYGKVPTTVSNTVPFNAVSLYGPASGIAIDQISVYATSADMNTFNTLYAQKQSHLKSLQSNGIAQGYIDIYSNVLNASKTLAATGSVEGAIQLLNGLNVSDEPASSTLQALFLPLIGVIAAVAIVFLVLFLRARGKMGYFQLVVEDQIKDLEGLTLRAAKVDRAMSANLDSVKDRLKQLVGM